MAAGRGAAWRVIPRPVMETVLHNHALHHRVRQPLLLHGPRGVGKTSLLLHRLIPEWNKGPHITAYVDFSSDPSGPTPWGSATSVPDLTTLQSRLDTSLETLANRAIMLGQIGSREIFSALNNWHGLHSTLKHFAGPTVSLTGRVQSLSALWSKAVISRLNRISKQDLDSMIKRGEKKYSMEEIAYIKESIAALGLAKEVLGLQYEWRKEAVKNFNLNRNWGFSRSLANMSTDWPCLLIELLSQSAETDFFQPKLVLNNIDVLRRAISENEYMVPASVYHDSLIWRIISLGANDKCIPVILATSDGYYSYQAFIDFGFPDIFISRETFGWMPQEAKLHMVSDFFTETEWRVIDEVLGPNPRQLSELYMLKQKANELGFYNNGTNSFEDIVDAYLSYLQITVVNPAMDAAVKILQKFCSDVCRGKIPETRLFFGSPWRHPPRTENPSLSLKWAKIQLMDFVQSFVNTEFGVNYLVDESLEILDDPATVAMLEVGLLYSQRDPSFIRPVTRGIERCLIRWLVQQKMELGIVESIEFSWQRIIRGRSYRHLMIEIGYKS